MGRVVSKWIVCLACTTAAASCGKTETDSGTSGDEGMTPSSNPAFEAWVRQLAVTLCEKNCGDTTNVEQWYGVSCLETVTLQYEVQGAIWRRLLEAGTTSFDEIEAQRCIDEWAASECGQEEQFRVPLACDEVFVGNLPVDSPCGHSLECAGDAYCYVEANCVARCVANVGEGGECPDPFGRGCQKGLACSARGACITPKASGEACESSNECQSDLCDEGRCAEPFGYLVQELAEPCLRTYHCAPDLYCAENTCQPKKQVGDPCQTVAEPCAMEAFCNNELGDGYGVCVERIPIGERCETNTECTTTLCADGVCQARSGLGGSCTTTDQCWAPRCEAGVCTMPASCP